MLHNVSDVNWRVTVRRSDLCGHHVAYVNIVAGQNILIFIRSFIGLISNNLDKFLHNCTIRLALLVISRGKHDKEGIL